MLKLVWNSLQIWEYIWNFLKSRGIFEIGLKLRCPCNFLPFCTNVKIIGTKSASCTFFSWDGIERGHPSQWHGRMIAWTCPWCLNLKEMRVVVGLTILNFEDFHHLGAIFFKKRRVTTVLCQELWVRRQT